MTKISFLRDAAMYTLVSLMTMAGTIYMHHYEPQTMQRLLISLDVFGVTDVATKEQMRLAQIKSLKIPYEMKQALAKRTVFMGASQTMVFLALGNPNNVLPTSAESHEVKPLAPQKWVYYFNGDTRPTVLEFDDKSLISAEKGTMLDVAENRLRKPYSSESSI